MLSSTIAAAQPGNQPIPQAPPSGPGLGQQPTQLGNAQFAPVNPVQLTPEEKRQLEDNEAEFERFSQAATAQDLRMRAIAKRDFDSRSAELAKRYADKIAKIQSDAAASREANERVAATVAQIEQRQREITGEIEEQVRVVHAMQSTLTQAARSADAIVERLRSVAGAAQESSAEAELVRNAAMQLEAMSERLGALVGRFTFDDSRPEATSATAEAPRQPEPIEA
jgi:methyl-accepting chemotaxis protein